MGWDDRKVRGEQTTLPFLLKRQVKGRGASQGERRLLWCEAFWMCNGRGLGRRVSFVTYEPDDLDSMVILSLFPHL